MNPRTASRTIRSVSDHSYIGVLHSFSGFPAGPKRTRTRIENRTRSGLVSKAAPHRPPPSDTMAGMGSTERAKTHSALSSPSRVALLQELRAADGPVDAHQLAASCDLHVTTVRFHLTALVEAGLVDTDRAPAVGRGRPRLLYRPVSRFDTGQADDPYLQIARVLAEAWNQDLPGDPAERAVE